MEMSINEKKKILLSDVIQTGKIIEYYINNNYSEESLTKFKMVFDKVDVSTGSNEDNAVAVFITEHNLIMVNDEEYFFLEENDRIMVLIHEYCHAILSICHTTDNINDSFVIDEAMPDILSELIMNYYIEYYQKSIDGVSLITGYDELREVIKPVLLILREKKLLNEALENYLFLNKKHFYQLCEENVTPDFNDYISYCETDNINNSGNTRPYMREEAINIIRPELAKLINSEVMHKVQLEFLNNYENILYQGNYVLEFLVVEYLVKSVIGDKDIKDINREDIEKLINCDINFSTYTNISRFSKYLEILALYYYVNNNNIDDFVLIVKFLKRTPIHLFEKIIQDNINFRDQNNSVTKTVYALANALKVNDIAESKYLLNMILNDQNRTYEDTLKVIDQFVSGKGINERIAILNTLIKQNDFLDQEYLDEDIENVGIELNMIFEYDHHLDNYEGKIQDQISLVEFIKNLNNSQNKYKEVITNNFDNEDYLNYKEGIIQYLIEIVGYIHNYSSKLLPNSQYEKIILDLLSGNFYVNLNLQLSNDDQNVKDMLFLLSGVISHDIDYFYNDIILFVKKSYDIANNNNKEKIKNCIFILNIPFKDELLEYMDKEIEHSIILKK